MGRKKRLLKTDIPRKVGYLYYLKGDPLEIYEVEMNRGRKKKGKR